MSLDEDMNDSLVDEATNERESTASSSSSGGADKKQLFDKDNQIGFMKNNQFCPLTNFSVDCVGYVVDNAGSTSANGFLFKVNHKDCKKPSEANESDARETRCSYYLTWRDMSTQLGILNAISSIKLWTAPSKEQYLPAYFKSVCDKYMSSAASHRVFPVECLGRQKSSAIEEPIWVLGEDAHVILRNGVAEKLPLQSSPFYNLDSKVSSMPSFSFEDDLDSGQSLKDLINTMHTHMKSNFASSLLVLGGLGLAVHYEQLCNMFDGIPVILAWGKPVSGKSTAVKLAMALLGQHDSVGECTLAAALELASKRTIPFFWDDASDFRVLEKLSVAAFNKSQKKTYRKIDSLSPRTVPMVTMNPQVLKRTIKTDKEKIGRVFSRIAVVPFNRVAKEQNLECMINFQTEIKPLINKVVQSVSVILELSNSFSNIKNDDLFKEIMKMPMEGLDMRAQLNYALLVFSTGKILEKLGLKENYFPMVRQWVVDAVLPNHLEIMSLGNTKSPAGNERTDTLHDEEIEEEMKQLLHEIVQTAASNPEKVKGFFKPKFISRKCFCGEVFGIKVGKMMQFLEKASDEERLRSYIRKSRIGCNSVKLTFQDQGQQHGSHISRRVISPELLIKLDRAWNSSKNDGSSGDNEAATPVTVASDDAPDFDSAKGDNEAATPVTVASDDAPDFDSAKGDNEAATPVTVASDDAPDFDSAKGDNEAATPVTVASDDAPVLDIGKGKRKADNLLDDIHPGILKGKRVRRSRKTKS